MSGNIPTTNLNQLFSMYDRIEVNNNKNLLYNLQVNENKGAINNMQNNLNVVSNIFFSQENIQRLENSITNILGKKQME